MSATTPYTYPQEVSSCSLRSGSLSDTPIGVMLLDVENVLCSQLSPYDGLMSGSPWMPSYPGSGKGTVRLRRVS